MSPVVAGLGCLVASLATELEAGEAARIERTEVLVRSDGQCRSLSVRVPANAELIALDARIRLGDDSRVRVDPARWSEEEPGLEGDRLIRLALPDLLRGDTVRLRWELSTSLEASWTWIPGASAAVWAELRAPREGADVFGGLSGDPGRWWATRPGRDAGVRYAPPAPPPLAQVSERALSALDALARASSLALLPEGVEGVAPLAGDAAFARGWADPRGFARTVVALAADGPDPVALQSDLAGELAVWSQDGVATPLLHPDDPRLRGVDAPRPRADAYVVATLDLHIPEEAPALALQPGGAAWAAWEGVIGFAAAPEPRWWSLPLPAGATDLRVHAPEVVTWRQRSRDLLVLLPASKAPISLRVAYHLPDAPTWGEVPHRAGERHSLVVRAQGGEVRWEPGDDPWWLAEVHGVPVLADRDALLAGLEERLVHAALPEPALPLYLKRARDPELLASSLRDALHEKAGVVRLNVPLTHPRPLHASLKSGALSPQEAAWVLSLWARQAGLDASWAWVRPAELGPGSPVSPAGYVEGALAVQIGGQTRWIDVGCASCAPFELRPSLEGASAISRAHLRTSEPTRGAARLAVAEDTFALKLEGPAALLLREELRGVQADARGAWLAARYGGEGAALVAIDGVEQAGAPIRLAVRGGRPTDPLALPPADAEGDTWWVWPGERSRPDPGPALRVERPAFTLTRADGTLSLDVLRRAWTADDRAAFLAAMQPPPPEPVEDPLLPPTQVE